MSCSSIATDLETTTSRASALIDELFDVNSLLERCMGDRDLASMLLGRFEERLPAAIAEIIRLIDQGDCEAALKSIHSLKGEAGSLDAVTVQQAVADLESTLRSRQNAADPQVLQKLSVLSSAAAQCQTAIPQLLNTFSSPASAR